MSMLSKVRQWAKELTREPTPVNPARFADPIAEQTQWTPLSPGGASFRTHRVVPREPNGLEVSKTAGLYVFGAVFGIVGLGVGTAGALNGPWWLFLFGAVFCSAALLVLWPRRLLFDGNTRKYTGRGKEVFFTTIHAIQLVQEFVRGDKRSFWSYELNLVLTDGTRVHVMDHGDLPSVQSDAAQLSTFIGCKVWDATGPG